MARRNHLLQLDDAPVSGLSGIAPRRTDRRRDAAVGDRSEEHTSELQSRLHLVCRLLLEKKKTKQASKGSFYRLALYQPYPQLNRLHHRLPHHTVSTLHRSIYQYTLVTGRIHWWHEDCRC